MKYAAIIEYIPDAEKVQSVRPVHREYLGKLRERGKLAAAGPFPDGSGALIIYDAETAEDAEALLREDPFNQNGVFVSWVIRPWNQVF
jgi:uncharacterized protein YciI